MKKYVKPELFFEQYVLSQHIASCAFDKNLAYTSCEDGFTDGSGTVIIDGAPCTLTPDEIQDYCYTNGSAEITTIFNS